MNINQENYSEINVQTIDFFRNDYNSHEVGPLREILIVHEIVVLYSSDPRKEEFVKALLVLILIRERHWANVRINVGKNEHQSDKQED